MRGGALLELIGWGIIVVQCIAWLKNGVWYPVEVRDGFQALSISTPYTDWAGIQMVVEWLLNFPLSWTLIVLAFPIMFFGMSLGENADGSTGS